MSPSPMTELEESGSGDEKRGAGASGADESLHISPRTRLDPLHNVCVSVGVCM